MVRISIIPEIQRRSACPGNVGRVDRDGEGRAPKSRGFASRAHGDTSRLVRYIHVLGQRHRIAEHMAPGEEWIALIIVLAKVAIGSEDRPKRVGAQIKPWQLQARDKIVRTSDSIELSR